MNKQELIDEIKRIHASAVGCSRVSSHPLYADGVADTCSDVIVLLNHFDEPQKVKVPPFVAELLDYYRNSTDVDLLALLITFNAWYSRTDKNGKHEEAIDWLVKHPEKFMRAWLDGYEIETKYRVKIGNGYFIDYQGRGCLISPHEKDGIMIFKTKNEADRTANIIGGTVEKVEV